MKAIAHPSPVPTESAIKERLPGAYFYDCYAIEVPRSTRTALGHFLTAVAHTPPWVNSLMAVRNQVVQLLGLKNLGGLGAFDPSKPESAYLPGDRVGIFTLIANSDNEVLLGDSDKHLDVVLSAFKPSCHFKWRPIARDNHRRPCPQSLGAYLHASSHSIA